MIEFKNVTKHFGSRRVLDGLSFEVPQGQAAFLLGKSGAGKSVALRHIVGLEAVESGQVLVNGRDVSALDDAGLLEVRRECGMVFQFPALMDSLTVMENLLLGVREAEAPQTLAADLLRQVGLDAKFLSFFPPELSFGIQKRVSVARALAARPRVLLFDEPTTGLDPVASRAMHALIRDLNRSLGLTALVVSHDIEGALEVADQIFLLEGGRVVDQGSPQAIRQSQAPLTASFVREL
ncbi:ATP-binding cassette domain-containing protein [bacterium]|nr:ATP-binding cassette domain-containing protein [bacterium]